MKSKLIVYLLFSMLFLRCTNQEKKLEYKIDDTSKIISDTLYFKNKNISSVKVLIIGKIKGNAIIEFENGSGRMEKFHIKNQVNEIYETEWYASTLHFRYIPNNVKEGNIVIKYSGY